jgi:LysM repeat protein
MLDGPAQTYTIKVEPEDTIELLSKWSGHSVQEITTWNRELKTKGLVAGDFVRLILTEAEARKFKGQRDAYLADARTRQKMGLSVRKVVRYKVKEGETIQAILKNFNTTIDLLEKMNPASRLSRLRAGQEINIPIVALDEPALPGPQPPNPPPVPEPPQNPRPITAQPAPRKPDGTQVSQTVIYVVQSGDTAWVISRKKVQCTLEQLEALNPDVDLSRLKAGMKIRVPKVP